MSRDSGVHSICGQRHTTQSAQVRVGHQKITVGRLTTTRSLDQLEVRCLRNESYELAICTQ